MKERFHCPRRVRALGRQIKAAAHRIAHVLRPRQGFLLELVFGHVAFKYGDVYRKRNFLNMLARTWLENWLFYTCQPVAQWGACPCVKSPAQSAKAFLNGQIRLQPLMVLRKQLLNQ